MSDVQEQAVSSKIKASFLAYHREVIARISDLIQNSGAKELLDIQPANLAKKEGLSCEIAIAVLGRRDDLEMYKQDENLYPPNAGWSNALQAGNYMKSVPVDPLNNSTYIYARNAANSLMYTLKACLENVSDPDGANDSGWVDCASRKKYEITEP